jgi:TetR/AcrR family transcriptional regulator, mexJK operon transcriptional repressor
MSHPAEPIFAETRQHLLDAAMATFLEEGYRASMDRIAARAGVARQTLYNHFPAKETLFAEAVRSAIQSVLVTLEAQNGDIRSNLLGFAVAYRAKVLCPAAMAMFRTLVAEAPRFPELARNFFAGGPQQTIIQLARFLELAMERGDLRRDDPMFAAEMLTGMLANHDRLRGLINLETDVVADPSKAERVVNCFLRAYAPERT